jgi:hypothetical protein
MTMAGLLLAQPASAYDSKQDLRARSAEARSELGDRAQVELVEGVFLLVTPQSRGSLASARAVAKLALAAYFNGRFSRRPERPVSVYLFQEANGYEAYCQQRWRSPCMSPFGFYRPDERRIVMNVGPGLGTLTHELVHPIVEADFPQAPAWLNEGLASLYEGFSLPRAGHIRGVKNWRHPRLLTALRSREERQKATLPALFALTDAAFRGPDEDLNYATARYFCLWLEQQGKLWSFYQRYRDDYARDPTGAQAFAHVTGQSLADADVAWSSWAKRL